MFRTPFRHALTAVAALVAVIAASDALAQTTSPPNTIGASLFSGVSIDADGVLKHQIYRDPSGQLIRQRLAEARATLDQDIAQPSDLRKISLNRLEAALAKNLAEGRPATSEMKYLAGLTELRYVFYYPETRDIVIAGPAGGWVEDLSGRALGLHDGRPTLLLEDLVVALRAFSPNGRKAGTVHCSIDPTQEGLQRMQDFLQKIGGRATPRDTQFIVNGLQQSLGKQVISVGGISPKTNFARVMVEADYRMKLIGIGLEQPPIKLTSYVARATPGSVSRNAMQRWYFVPNYEAVRESADGLAMELVGQGVKLVGENEVVGQDGSRNAAARGDRAGSLFVKEFTTKYPQLAERSPVYAHLRNLIDMLVAAAYIQDRGFFGKAGWSMETFGSEQSYPVEVHTAPKQVASAVNAIWKGNRLMTPIGGGVMIQASKALAPEHIMYDEEGEVEKLRDTISLDELPADKWWWD